MSRCATRTAVNAPFNANANVPARSKTSSTEASDTARVDRIRTGDPSQTEDVTRGGGIKFEVAPLAGLVVSRVLPALTFSRQVTSPNTLWAGAGR